MRPAQFQQQRASSVRVAASNDAVSFEFFSRSVFRPRLSGGDETMPKLVLVRTRALPRFSLLFCCLGIGNGLDVISPRKNRQGMPWKTPACGLLRCFEMMAFLPRLVFSCGQRRPWEIVAFAFLAKPRPFAPFLRVYCMGDMIGETEAVEMKEPHRRT